MYCIYKLTCRTTNESYIGQTSNLERRLAYHQLPSSDCVRIRNAIQKYGWSDFTVTVLVEGLSEEDANVWEKELITNHNTLSPHGYNLQTGGDHRTLSEESRQKISLTLTGRSRSEETKLKCSIAHTGKSLSDDHKAKISATRLRGIPRSAETKAKISAAQTGRKGREGCELNFTKLAAARKGKPLSDEHRNKIKEARTGTTRSEETKAKIRAAALKRNQLKAERAMQLHDTDHIVDQPPTPHPA